MNAKKLLIACVCCLAGLTFLMATGCSPSSPKSNDQGASAANSEGFSWSEDADCSACHKAESSNHVAAHESLGCAICHNDTDALATVHESTSPNDKNPSSLKKTKVSEAVCLSCHDDYQDLAAKTSSSTALTDSNGKTVNPHEIKSYGGSEHQSIVCADCHKEHSSASLTETAQSFCINCHHENVYECHTCHE